ncbi:hypothetical protein ACH4XT_39190 [Streptomyces avidinii]
MTTRREARSPTQPTSVHLTLQIEHHLHHVDIDRAGTPALGA